MKAIAYYLKCFDTRIFRANLNLKGKSSLWIIMVFRRKDDMNMRVFAGKWHGIEALDLVNDYLSLPLN